MRDLAAMKADFRVVVIFDNEKCGVDAFRVAWRLLAGIKPGTRVDVRLWQSETMKEEANWKQLNSDLKEATAIIIATEGDTALRSAVDQWKSGFASQTENGKLVVAVLEQGIPFLLQTEPAPGNAPSA